MGFGDNANTVFHPSILAQSQDRHSGDCGRLNTRHLEVKECTASPFWFNVVLRTLMMAWFGSEHEGAISSISLSTCSVSPGRAGLGHARSSQADNAIAQRQTAIHKKTHGYSRRVPSMAASPPNTLLFAATRFGLASEGGAGKRAARP